MMTAKPKRKICFLPPKDPSFPDVLLILAVVKMSRVSYTERNIWNSPDVALGKEELASSLPLRGDKTGHFRGFNGRRTPIYHERQTEVASTGRG